MIPFYVTREAPSGEAGIFSIHPVTLIVLIALASVAIPAWLLIAAVEAVRHVVGWF